MAEQLKPCPFCGANLTHIERKYINNSGIEVYEDYFEHPLGGCILEVASSDGIRFGNTNMDIAAWNRRYGECT